MLYIKKKKKVYFEIDFYLLEEGDPNLVIPLHDKSEHGMNKQQPIIMKNRMPGYDTMVCVI